MKNAEAPIPVDIERRLGDAGRRLGARHDLSFAYLFGGLASVELVSALPVLKNRAKPRFS